jgi:hypothetical protein
MVIGFRKTSAQDCLDMRDIQLAYFRTEKCIDITR